MSRNLLAPILCILFVMASTCSAPSTVGNGGSSETVNAEINIQDTTVQIVFEANSPVNATAQFFSPDYRPYNKLGYSSDVITSTSTGLQWRAPNAGVFNIYIRDTSSGRAFFIEHISLQKDTSYTIHRPSGTITAISGKLITTDSSCVNNPYIVSINGSPFFTTSDENGDFELEYIPEGTTSLFVREDAHRLFVKTAQYRIPYDATVQFGEGRIIVP
jgi:hypothetical protein